LKKFTFPGVCADYYPEEVTIFFSTVLVFMKIFIITQKYDPVFEKNLRSESKFILAVFRTKQHRKFFSPEGWTSNSTGSTGAVAIKPFQPPFFNFFNFSNRGKATVSQDVILKSTPPGLLL
jgi:hypothetical protein